MHVHGFKKIWGYQDINYKKNNCLPFSHLFSSNTQLQHSRTLQSQTRISHSCYMLIAASSLLQTCSSSVSHVLSFQDLDWQSSPCSGTPLWQREEGKEVQTRAAPPEVSAELLYCHFHSCSLGSTKTYSRDLWSWKYSLPAGRCCKAYGQGQGYIHFWGVGNSHITHQPAPVEKCKLT